MYGQFGKLLGSIYGNHLLARYPLNSHGERRERTPNDWVFSHFLPFRGNKLIDFKIYEFIMSLQSLYNTFGTIILINLLSQSDILIILA